MSAISHKVWKANTKMSWANERTLIAWVRVGATFGSSAILASVMHGGQRDGLSDDKGLIGWSATAQACLGLLVVSWGFLVYLWRGRLLRERWHGAYEAPLGPAVIASATVVSLLVTVTITIARIHQYYSDDCLALPDRHQMSNATPPFLYVSFHGVSHPRRSMCDARAGVGGIHRFTLGGDYAGPATDQRGALLRYPRGMAMTLGLVFVADSDLDDSSLAVFGACANAGVRPFLGRIRPSKSDATHAAFEHPYAVVTTSDPHKLRVSTQNGGAILQVDTSTGAMELERQVDPHVSKHSASSGYLRGLAVDSAGCEHVSDKHDDAVWHYCDGAVATMSKVRKPIDLFADGGLLYVGSFDQKKPRVLALDLAAPPGPEGKRIVRSYVDERLRHPAGLLVHQGTLYVLEQTSRALLAFDAATAAFKGVVLDALPDTPEKLLLVNEC